MARTGELLNLIRTDGEALELPSELSDRIEELYASIDWQTLSRYGYDKKGDYCFIYSYPPVRTLEEMPSARIFEPSKWERTGGPVSMYLHIPYCTGICSYCYFAKVTDNSHAPVDKNSYVELLLWELDEKMRRYGRDVEIKTIHFGGGTPSLLEKHQLSRILEYLHTLNLSPDAEITLECAPETICEDIDKLNHMRECGINRINLGVESFDNRMLKLMGRRHTSDQTLRAFANLREAGFDNIATDVIYAAPGETLSSWAATVSRVIELQPESISCYRLRTHPMKAISRFEYDIAGYEESLKMQLAHGLILDDAGYVRVSSQKYARKPETINRHSEQKRGVSENQLISAGCGAYGFLNATFYWNTKSLAEYGRALSEKRHPTWIGRKLDKEDLMRKVFVLGFHTNSGILLRDFHEHFGVDPIEMVGEELAEAEGLGLLERDKSRVRPTELGYFFGDELSVRFYSPRVRAVLDELGMKYGMFWERDRYV